MRVIKVIVDELPEGCKYCEFGKSGYGICQITKREIWYTSDNGMFDYLFSKRPDWCPLVAENEAYGGFIIDDPEVKEIVTEQIRKRKP